MAPKVWTSSFQSIPELSEIMSGVLQLQVKNDGVCKGCALGKNIKKPFPNSDNKSKEALDLIHSDVCGLMPMKSHSGVL